MELTKDIIKFLRIIKNVNNNKIDKYLEINKNSLKINLNEGILCEINSDSIILNEKINLLKKIRIKDYNENYESKINQFESFIKEISNSIIRLNHVGIAYFCKNINDEIESYQEILKNSKMKIYEEDSGDPKERWLFLGNLNDWESPLFEIVLLDPSLIGGKFVNKLSPHFQIDIDTNLSFDELEALINKFLGSNFLDWHLDFSEGGVLVMGTLNAINGTKIRLGLATKLRNTESHRKEILKEIVPS